MTIFLLLLSHLAFGQDFYEIISEAEMPIRYPERVSIEVTEDSLFSTDFQLDKKYWQVKVIAPWYTKPVVYKHSRIIKVSNDQSYPMDVSSYEYLAKPKLIEKVIEKSGDLYRLRLVFSNDLIFEIKDGVPKATQNNVELNVINRYLVQTSEGLFKISFSSQTGVLWYVIEL